MLFQHVEKVRLGNNNLPIKTKTFGEFAYQDVVAQQSGLFISKRNTSNAHGLIYSHRGNEKNAESVLLTWERADYERKGGEGNFTYNLC